MPGPSLRTSVVDRPDTPVMRLRTADEVQAIRDGFDRVERLVGLRGRRYFGAFYDSPPEYHVCVQVQEGDDPAALGLEPGVPPGGRYLRARLAGEPPAVYDRIAVTFEMLHALAPADGARPDIEHYRSRAEIDLLMPIR